MVIDCKIIVNIILYAVWIIPLGCFYIYAWIATIKEIRGQTKPNSIEEGVGIMNELIHIVLILIIVGSIVVVCCEGISTGQYPTDLIYNRFITEKS